jgi:hypothetical protein
VIIAEVIDRPRRLVRGLKEVTIRSLRFVRCSVTDVAYPMLLTTVVYKPPSMLPDEGTKLLSITYKLVAAESLQFEARFGGLFFFPDMLCTSAFKAGRALYLVRNIQL